MGTVRPNLGSLRRILGALRRNLGAGRRARSASFGPRPSHAPIDLGHVRPSTGYFDEMLGVLDQILRQIWGIFGRVRGTSMRYWVCWAQCSNRFGARLAECGVLRHQMLGVLGQIVRPCLAQFGPRSAQFGQVRPTLVAVRAEHRCAMHEPARFNGKVVQPQRLLLTSRSGANIVPPPAGGNRNSSTNSG